MEEKNRGGWIKIGSIKASPSRDLFGDSKGNLGFADDNDEICDCNVGCTGCDAVRKFAERKKIGVGGKTFVQVHINRIGREMGFGRGFSL